MIISDIKALLPQSIWRPMGKLRAVARRLNIWWGVRARISGLDPQDCATLSRAIRRSPITVCADLHHWQFPMVDEDCTVVSKGIGTFCVRADTDDLFQVLPLQEPAVQSAIRSILKAGNTFVDAGASIGIYTLLASQLVGGKGRVIPSKWSRLPRRYCAHM